LESKLRPIINKVEQDLNELKINSQSRDKKQRKKFNLKFQMQLGRSTFTVGTKNFTFPHNFMRGKGVNMNEVCSGSRSGKVKRIYILLHEILLLIDQNFAGLDNDWVVNISAMTKGSHYVKKHVDKEDIDSQYAFTLGSFTGGILRSYNNLGEFKDINNFRRVVRFDGRLPHEVSQVLSGCRYSIIFFKLYDRRMTRSAPILNNPKFVTNFIAPEL